MWAAVLGGARAETPGSSSPPPQVRELLRLLDEPGVRGWLEEELKKAPAAKDDSAGPERSSAEFAAERLALARERLDRFAAAVPRLPEEARRAAALLGQELQNRSAFGIVLLVLGFGLLGWGARWAFWRATRRARHRAEHAPYDTAMQPARDRRPLRLRPHLSRCSHWGRSAPFSPSNGRRA